MTSRRKFLKNAILSSTLMIPGAVKSEANFLSSRKKNFAQKPLFLSTWNHGQAANEKAWEILQNSGSILDAVEEGVKVTEADIRSRSVGLTGFPDRDGHVTLDASIMNSDGNCGSVCFVERIKHPITLARKVMEETPHVMLAGDGAQQFAVSQGMPLEDVELPDDVVREYEEWKETSEYNPAANSENHDTIGMVGIDGDGNLAGSCTTSGLKFKMHGRVGDSPIIGAGLYVDNEVGAATATGMGETIIKVCGSFLIVELMRQGRTPQEACEEAIDRLLQKTPFETDSELQVGFLAIDKNGDHGAYAVQSGFTYAIHHQEGNSIENSDCRYETMVE
ncbi:isoaspartyl peptidase/L-asparaginase family protein [Rhodohalobacter sulfatireducens]|uniref:N(4)-(Beta-N-acetylglucosaminyl)-L-asparaginase n=1 Tax=Rhodohalobacter sulfatireducens TaxID=2911366 RepID=A0ABS9K9K6_9BACT|nr:N(4)-(beta-N-acetylglucosaminyl)-L-asparaginase [Rhodohalobacter sulfatireducens]MCG2587544.1 N(4)-(beta-N-acetylglucosaminyl)-L-asparaginase [Rhodohalobacter sulfatireducens]